MKDLESDYIQWYKRLKHFAREYVFSDKDAEDIVHDVFLKLYECNHYAVDKRIPVNYIFGAVRNRCIDLLRRQITEHEATHRLQEEQSRILQLKLDTLEALDERLWEDGDLEEKLRQAIAELPERCRTILILHKLHGMRQKQIAAVLNISPKTVEHQVAIALEKLRMKLKL